MPPLAFEYSDVQPGIYTLVVIAVVLVVAVLVAKRERDRRERLGASLPPGSWTAPCLDTAAPAVKRLLVVGADELAIAETRTGSRDSWPWAEVAGVAEAQVRSRMQTHPGIRLAFADGSTRELLVYVGDGRAAYRDGALAAHARIERRLQSAEPS